MNNGERVRRWLKSGVAGLVIGVNPVDCLKKAWGASGGLSMSMGDFTDCLHTEGFRPDQIRPKVWHLNMPDRPSR